MRHGPQVTDVKKQVTQRWDDIRDISDVGFVTIRTGDVNADGVACEGVAEAGVG